MQIRTLSLLVSCLLSASALAAEGGDAIAITYRSSSNVYVDAGSDSGLAVGDHLLIMESGETLGEIEIVFLSERSAACRVVSEKRPVRSGDVVVPLPKQAAMPAALEPEEQPEPRAPTVLGDTSRRRGRPWARVRGVVALGYYRIWDESSSQLDFEQTTTRLGLTLSEIGGQPYTFRLRARTREVHRARALSARNPGNQRLDRLYEMSLRYATPGGSVAYELGRLGASRYVGIGYLDGVLVRLGVADDLGVGGFFGEESDIDGFRFAGSGRKYGAFLDLSPGGRYSNTPYDLILAVVREFDGAETSRDYVSFDGRAGWGGGWSLYTRGEVDVNNGWRIELADSRYQLSNVSASLDWRFARSSSFSLSYDGRRSFRSRLNREVPEEIFDDLLRQGLRASLHVGSGSGLSVTAGGGVRFKEGDEEKTYSFNGGAQHADLWGSGFSAGVNVSGFSNPFTVGALVILRVGKRLGYASQIDLAYGRSSYEYKATTERRETQWVRLQGRVDVYRGLYLLLDLEYDMGDDLAGPRGLVELGHLF